jgi:hypothetical protein
MYRSAAGIELLSRTFHYSWIQRVDRQVPGSTNRVETEHSVFRGACRNAFDGAGRPDRPARGIKTAGTDCSAFCNPRYGLAGCKLLGLPLRCRRRYRGHDDWRHNCNPRIHSSTTVRGFCSYGAGSTWIERRLEKTGRTNAAAVCGPG